MSRLSLVILLGSSVLGGCQEPFSNDDLLFLKSLPSRHDLAFRVPDDEQGLRSAAAPRAEFHDRAKEISDGLNASIHEAVAVIEDLVTKSQPTAREDNLRVYGPFSSGGAELVLTIARTATDTTLRPTSTSSLAVVLELFAYALRGRKQGAPEDWTVLLEGVYAPDPDFSGGLGRVALDFEAARGLGVNIAERGRFAIGYERAETERLELVAVSSPAAESSRPDVVYRFAGESSGAVDFQFGLRSDLHGDGAGGSLLETLLVDARYRADRAGRADIVVFDGDLATPVFASECWSSSLLRVYFFGSVPELGPPYGSETDCADPFRSSRFPRQE
ncbi:MAG: hypothetical protein HYV07_30030 [Deltaproteobacteria bacterium]|nr:hypothetical protein [Deltaproteobacteria bacterium]